MDRFVEYTLELLEPLGPVRARAMFGGWGLYCDGVMMGLIIRERLYLKTDETTRPAFQAAGGEPFVYDAGKGKAPVALSYWTPPAEAEDDAHALLPWARRALEAALRVAAQKQQKSARKSPAAKRVKFIRR
ncbi:TfoX/Sxy family protein [Stigmatella erecta]|uniref:DNA transformation protein n=1 Tax=Stigmatella erecta TaxID=83460 RepID=A0A1I0EJK8_9BACT|nr:TfoX/Sxy family protein [Stigmatella erecta]SET45602.1 DNA transformation protein [Stigmatella erecta]